MTTSAAKDELIYQKVTAHLAGKYNVKLEGGVDENTDLFIEGLLDSIGFVELVSFLEKTFGIQLNESELSFENVNTVAHIVETVKKRS
ncbi:MAG TPA: acyl carrier protein [Planktothrix sp.]|jgi:acyl carrier protein